MKKTPLLFCLLMIFAAMPNLHAQVPPPDPFSGNRDFILDAINRMNRTLENANSEPTLQDAHFLGRAIAAHILAMYRPYTQKPAFTRYVNTILQTLVINSSRPVLFKGYFAVILDSPEINAFATPGGHIFLTRGLAEAATSEEMLAAVLAHELAHVVLDHGLGMINSMAFSNEVSEIANRAAGFAGNSADAAMLMSFRSSVSGIVETMVKGGYSREQEFAADREAVAILAAAGYNPRGLLEILEVLQRSQTNYRGGFFATHPSPADRIGNVEESVRLNQVPDTTSYRRARFTRNR